MKAITYERVGDSSVLVPTERAPRDPAVGEVRVRVVVSGVNPTDWKSRTLGAVTGPQVPNQDGAGIVDAVGDGVSTLSVGNRVWLWDVAWQSPEGTAQEYVTLPAEHAVLLPDGETFDTGASLGIPALTAHLALTANERGPSRLAPGALAGRSVLVTGGAGAVGHAAIQLAVWAGATVITTVSSDAKAALATAAGAQHVLNYRTDDVPAAIRGIVENGVETIVDVDVAANLTDDLAVLAPNGTIACYAFDGDGTLTVPVRVGMGKNTRYQFILTYTASAAAKADAITAVSAALAEGRLRVGAEHGLPLGRFTLDQTGAAHDAVEAGFVGKVLIDVS